MRSLKVSICIVLTLWVFAILLLAFGVTNRLQFEVWIPLLAVAALAYFYLGKSHLNARTGYAALGFVAVFIIPVQPVFSDDFYRFYWDGLLFSKGLSVYAQTPAELMQMGYEEGLLDPVFAQLNSPRYYAIYTPINQFFYAVPFWLGIHSLTGFVMVLRMLFLAIGVGGFLGLLQGLKHLRFPITNAWWVVGNPLLWIEGYMNLHIEWAIIFIGFMALPFLLKSPRIGSLIFPVAIGLKFSTVPLLLGYLLPKRSWKNKVFLILGLALMATITLVFIPMKDIQNMLDSIALFTKTFEFNGFFYPIVNTFISALKGFNAISITGRLLSVVALVLIGVRWIITRRGNVSILAAIAFVQWSSVVYLLCSTTVHPWYLIIPVATLAFVPNRFVLAWSATVFLSYLYYQDFSLHIWWWGPQYLIPGVYALYPRLFQALGWNSNKVERR